MKRREAPANNSMQRREAPPLMLGVSNPAQLFPRWLPDIQKSRAAQRGPVVVRPGDAAQARPACFITSAA